MCFMMAKFLGKILCIKSSHKFLCYFGKGNKSQFSGPFVHAIAVFLTCGDLFLIHEQQIAI